MKTSRFFSNFDLRDICLLVLFFISLLSVRAQNALERAGKGISYSVEGSISVSDGNSPLWMNANRYGLSSVKGDNGYVGIGVCRSADLDSASQWRIGFGAELYGAYNFTSSIVVQQLYADFDYRLVRLSVGSKERPMAFKNQQLSTGSHTLGINARPVPEVRFELPEYWSITGKSNWAAIKGHIGFGMMTDGNWQEDYVVPGYHYAKNALFHSKAGYLRIGNEEKFPLVFEGGLEMATQFGGTIYNPIGREGVYSDKLEMGTGLSDFVDALLGTGSDATDENYANAAGNTLGSWLFSLSYHGKDWKLRAYYDHFFEDHSMMFFEYGWKDGLIGVEATLPHNPFVSSVVYEFMNTTYQSGPVYHDCTTAVPDQISGIDNYYNHNLYQGWQHWGQSMGNALFTSPLYRNDGTLKFTGNRFKAHHVGICGSPLPCVDYRLLYTKIKNWGTYAAPAEDVLHGNSFLFELNYRLPRMNSWWGEGWKIGASFAMDRGKCIGNHTGFQLTIAKSGLLCK